MLTQKQIAARLGLAQITVSRVLNNHPSVKPATRRRVLAALGRGYALNVNARNLVLGRSGRLALVIPGADAFQSPFLPLVMAGIAEESRRRHYAAFFINMQGVGQPADLAGELQGADAAVVFIKEGRVESGGRTFDELGTGAGLFSTRYKDSGIEAGFSGQPWFINVSMTSGVVGQEERSFPSSQGGSKRAITRRGGFITKHASLGGSIYTNDNELLDRRIIRYGGFGWVRAGRFALMFEHDEGEDEKFTVSGSTQISASYGELIYAFPFPGRRTSYLKFRYERLDPNRSLDNDGYERFVPSYRFSPTDYVSIETFYRKNKEESVEKANDDIYVLTRVFF